MMRSVLLIAALGVVAVAFSKFTEERRRRELLARQLTHELEALRRAALRRLAA